MKINLLSRAPGHDSIFVTMSTKNHDTGSEQVNKILHFPLRIKGISHFVLLCQTEA